MRQPSAVEQEALAAFKEQRVKLDSIADKDVHDPAFISWKTVTTEVFERYLSESTFRSRFVVPAFICLLTRAIPLKLTPEESVPLKDVLTVPLSTSSTLLGIGNKARPTAAKLAPYQPVLTRLLDAAQKMLR